jgi:hypothetical protein
LLCTEERRYRFATSRSIAQKNLVDHESLLFCDHEKLLAKERPN